MFVVGRTGGDVNEYALTAAFDVSAASFVSPPFPVSSQEILPTGIAFSADGTRMFVVGLTGSGVNEYALTAAFDVSTASFTHAFSVASQDSSPGDVTFSADGTRMFVTGDIGDDVNEYALTAAFDVSTASFTDSFSVRSEDNSPTGVAFSSDGTRMFVVGNQNDNVYEYALGLTFGIALTGTPPDTTPPDTTDAFITTWNTDDPYQAVTFPGTGAYHIDWGDGTTENATGAATHTYATEGSHTVSVSGGLEWVQPRQRGRQLQRLPPKVDRPSGGDIRWTSMEGAFRSATEMVYNAHDVPDLSNVTSMRKHVLQRQRLRRRPILVERLVGHRHGAHVRRRLRLQLQSLRLERLVGHRHAIHVRRRRRLQRRRLRMGRLVGHRHGPHVLRRPPPSTRPSTTGTSRRSPT